MIHLFYFSISLYMDSCSSCSMLEMPDYPDGLVVLVYFPVVGFPKLISREVPK